MKSMKRQQFGSSIQQHPAASFVTLSLSLSLSPLRSLSPFFFDYRFALSLPILSQGVMSLLLPLALARHIRAKLPSINNANKHQKSE